MIILTNQHPQLNKFFDTLEENEKALTQYFLSSLYTKQTRAREGEVNEEGYVYLCLKFMRRQFGRTFADTMPAKLKAAKIIDIDDTYMSALLAKEYHGAKEAHSMSYIILDKYSAEDSWDFAEVEPKICRRRKKLPARAERIFKREQKIKNKKTNYITSQTKAFMGLDPAFWDSAELSAKPHYRLFAKKAEKGLIGVSLSDLVGRCSNICTSVGGRVRAYVTICGEKSVALDAKACQPFLMLDEFQDADESKLYAQWLDDGIYEVIANLAGTDTDSVKIGFVRFLGGAGAAKTNGVDGVLKDNFPKFYKQHRANKRKEDHGYLARKLQKLESSIMIDDLLLNYMESIPMVTVHDEIIVRLSDKEIARKAMQMAFYRTVGRIPKITASDEEQGTAEQVA